MLLLCLHIAQLTVHDYLVYTNVGLTCGIGQGFVQVTARRRVIHSGSNDGSLSMQLFYSTASLGLPESCCWAFATRACETKAEAAERRHEHQGSAPNSAPASDDMVVTPVLQQMFVQDHHTCNPRSPSIEGFGRSQPHMRPTYVAQCADCGLITAAARFHCATNSPTKLELHRSPPTTQPSPAGY
jgi:hypothetical protein